MKRPKVPQPRTPKRSIVASIRGKDPPSRQEVVENYGFMSVSHLEQWISQEFNGNRKKGKKPSKSMRELIEKLDTGDETEKSRKSTKAFSACTSTTVKASSNEENIGGTMNNITDNTKATTSEATSTEATKQMIRKVSAAIDEVRDLLSTLIDWRTDLYEELEFPCFVHPSYNGIIPKYAKIVAWEHLENESILDSRYDYLDQNIRNFVNNASVSWIENPKTQIFVGDLSVQILLTSIGVPWNN